MKKKQPIKKKSWTRARRIKFAATMKAKRASPTPTPVLPKPAVRTYDDLMHAQYARVVAYADILEYHARRIAAILARYDEVTGRLTP